MFVSKVRSHWSLQQYQYQYQMLPELYTRVFSVYRDPSCRYIITGQIYLLIKLADIGQHMLEGRIVDQDVDTS